MTQTLYAHMNKRKKKKEKVFLDRCREGTGGLLSVSQTPSVQWGGPAS
jgi:hypothetical protein